MKELRGNLGRGVSLAAVIAASVVKPDSLDIRSFPADQHSPKKLSDVWLGKPIDPAQTKLVQIRGRTSANGSVDSAMLPPQPQEMFARVEQEFYVRCKQKLHLVGI